MELIVRYAPRFDAAEAAVLLKRHFGIEGAAHPLPGERDQNFLVTTAGGERFVLKIANAAEPRAALDLQHAVLEHLATRGVPGVPRVRPTLDGAPAASADGRGGTRHDVRLLTWVPGRPLAAVRPHAPALLEDVGRRLGELNRALDDFSHPAMHRALPWDPARASWIREHLPRLPDPSLRARVERTLDRFERSVVPALPSLRAAVVHNDWNDHNVLVDVGPGGDLTVAGAIDFGDLLYSRTICDPAIACAYAMLDKPDPLAAAAAVVRGYHGAWPIPEAELPFLFELACARLCISATMAVLQSEQAPGNDYLLVSQRQTGELLERLDAVAPAWAHYVFRHACGLAPCPQSGAIVSWLERRRDRFAPVLEHDLSTAPVAVFDLSPGSTLLPSSKLASDPLAFTGPLFERIAEAGAVAGVGRYDEPRLFYAGDRFARPGNDGPEQRTIHVGLDLFAPAGAPVRAPLGGTVHGFADNAAPLDYGPTVVLRHETDEGNEFFTLYGHLSLDSLDGLQQGAPVAAGDRIGTIGTPEVNGGWPPHLHLQIVLDMLGSRSDFQGVAPAAERPIWLSLCPDPNLLVGIPEAAFPPRPASGAEIFSRRRRLLGPNLSVSYRRPLTIVRGVGRHLVDENGRRYLDCVNNVAHVGHAHPHVVRAVADQMAVLATNTRYLHERLVAYAERLTATLPDPLRICYVVSSGSEANELALRLARAYTGRRDVIVLDGAYHGNTSSLIEMSPYKLTGPGGFPPPPHVHTALMPDPYRGPYRAGTPEVARRYAASVRGAVDRAAARGGAAAFFFEPLLSCGGQIVPPEGYLPEACAIVRAAGGVCVADEIQVGLGRVGTHVWGFETQGVVPDIVTIGKSAGNGFPLAAVVTTRAIAGSFDNGMEYFNTCGGSPPACAAGLAVLDVLEREGLQARARAVGAALLRDLAGLRDEFPLVGDARGRGLFLGVELVADPERRTPASRQADYLVNRARDRGVLLSTDGPDRNVLKIKPPMVFGRDDAARLVSTLREILREDPAQPAV